MVSFVITSSSQPQSIPLLFKGKPTLQEQYGITSHITWYGHEYDDYSHNMNLIRQSGTNVVRTDYSAKNLSWGTSVPNYSRWDNIFNEARAKGIRLLPMVFHSYNSYTEDKRADYKTYLSSCVSRYGSNAVGWEIGNEIDFNYVKEGRNSPKEYLLLLKDSYETVKLDNPKNQVLLGAMGDIRNHYLEELLSLGASDYFDILNIHYYSAYSIPETIIPFYQKLDSINTQFQLEKPVWLTETGYISYSGAADQDIFYTKLLPDVYKKLGIIIRKHSLGLLYDERIKTTSKNQDNINIYHGFKSCHVVSLDQLKELTIKDCPVLMVLFREFFPKGYFDDLISYVKKGGTVVFPECGAALFNELDLETNELHAIGKQYYKPLHVSSFFPWDAEAKRNGVKKIRRLRTMIGNSIEYSWHEEEYSSPKFLTDANLKEGDEFIPLIEGKDSSYTGIVAACYKLDSDLKGNIIIQTRPNHSVRISEDLQGSRIPRLYLISYAVGIDKVFLYCLRDRQNTGGYGIVGVNDVEKPSFETFKTLSQFLPSGSTRPQLQYRNGQYIAAWLNPSGERVYCVWSNVVGMNDGVRVSGRANFYNEFGERIRKRKFKVSPRVIYIVGAKSVEFE